jgi:hypothetical protein
VIVGKSFERARTSGLSKVQGRHTGYQQHRRPVSDPGHPRSPGHLARQLKATAENPRPSVCMRSTARTAASYIVDDVPLHPINDDHLYRNPEYSWDEYIQA